MTDSKAAHQGHALALKTVMRQESSSFAEVLSKAGFQPFLWTQFLGRSTTTSTRWSSRCAPCMWRRHRAIRQRISVAGRRGVRDAVPALLRLFRPPGGCHQQAHGADLGQSIRDLCHAAGAGGLLLHAHRADAGGAVPDGAALHRLQPGQIRHRAGNAGRRRIFRAPTRCSK